MSRASKTRPFFPCTCAIPEKYVRLYSRVRGDSVYISVNYNYRPRLDSAVFTWICNTMAGVTPNVAPSPELLALTRHSSDLCRGITTVWTITSFAQSLEQEGFITTDAKSSILSTLGISSEGKCVHLLDAVKEQVRIDPTKFNPIVGIFRDEAALTIYADMVTKTRGELIVANILV